MKKTIFAFTLFALACLCAALSDDDDFNLDNQDISDPYSEPRGLTPPRNQWISQHKPWWMRRRQPSKGKRRSNRLIKKWKRKQHKRTRVVNHRIRYVDRSEISQGARFDPVQPWGDRSVKDPQHIRIRIRLRRPNKKKTKKAKKIRRKIVSREITEDDNIGSVEKHFLLGDKDDELWTQHLDEAAVQPHRLGYRHSSEDRKRLRSNANNKGMNVNQ